MKGKYFMVTSRCKGGSVDVVYVSEDGNLAATSADYCHWGFPGEHIFAVFNAGEIIINTRNHINSVYHLDFINGLDSNLMHDFDASTDIMEPNLYQINEMTVWDWAQTYTDAEWSEIGLGGESFEYAVHPSVRSITEAPETLGEALKKSMYILAPIILTDQDERRIFYEYYEGVLKR
jgi:hypothetical protein